MEFEKAFWDVMTTVGCIFSLWVVIIGATSVCLMLAEASEDVLKNWKEHLSGKRHDKDNCVE